MNNFKFNDHTLRHIDIDGEPWFVAADVCRCLGLNLSGGSTAALRPLACDEKRVLTRASISQYLLLEDSFFQPREPKLGAVNESGLYKLIMRANRSNPHAATFQDWVTREVLPSIRRTGGYLLNEHARETAEIGAFAISTHPWG